MGLTADQSLDKWNLDLRARVEDAADRAHRCAKEVKELERQPLPMPVGSEAWAQHLSRLGKAVNEVGTREVMKGLIAAHNGWSDQQINGPAVLSEQLTSVIMPNLNGFPHLQDAVRSLRRHTEGPVELIVVDNGSTDGSLEWLQQQADIVLLPMGSNVGAPAARNRGLEVARGETIVFCDNDVIFTPNWRDILIGHLESWPDIGMVGPMTDYVIGPQKVVDSDGCKSDLDGFAQRFHQTHRRKHAYTPRLILFFVMVRRSLIEKVGGIDERYGRWGFEDDDLSVRVMRAGMRQRIAMDCFIRHVGSQTAKTAQIDYDAQLLENWEVFKARWGLDPALPYGTRYSMADALALPWDAERDFIPFRTTGRVPGPVRLLTCAVPSPVVVRAAG
jgi:GT2 family glycosyltransferase